MCDQAFGIGVLKYSLVTNALAYSSYIDVDDKVFNTDCRVTMDELAKFHSVSHAYVMSKAKESSVEQVTIFSRHLLFPGFQTFDFRIMS